MSQEIICSVKVKKWEKARIKPDIVTFHPCKKRGISGRFPTEPSRWVYSEVKYSSTVRTASAFEYIITPYRHFNVIQRGDEISCVEQGAESGIFHAKGIKEKQGQEQKESLQLRLK